MHRSRGRVALGALAVCLAAVLLLPVAPVEGARTTPAASAAAAGPGIVTDARAIPEGSHVAPVASDRRVDLELSLTPSNASGLSGLVAELQDPGSPEYRHFLTETQFEARFAPPEAGLRALEAYFAAHGAVRVAPTADRLGLEVTLPIGAAEADLGVRYVSVRPLGASPFVTALGTPSLPASLAPLVTGIDGLTDLGPTSLARSLHVVGAGPVDAGAVAPDVVVNQSSGQWWFTGSDYVLGYHEEELFPPTGGVVNASFATGEAVATILMSGYNDTTATNLAPWDPAVVDAYFNDTFPNATSEPYSWPHPNVTGVPVTLDGIVPPPPGPSGSLGDDTLDVAENSLDLEMAGSFAPGAQVVNFYFAGSLSNAIQGNANASDYQDLADDFADCLGDALSYSYGGARLAAVTNSYGLPDLNNSLWDLELVHAAALGVTVVAASGDQGDAPNSATGDFQGPTPSWPATSAFNSSGVVAVGGATVNLSLNGAPSGSYDAAALSDPFDPSVAGLGALTAWYDTLGGSGSIAGTEGGISPVIAEPYWQRHSAAQPAIVNATVTQGLSQLGRAEPDVAFPANDTIAYVNAINGTVYFDLLQGTSIASPIFGGMIAELVAVSGHLLGFLDPELYRIGSFYAAHPQLGGDPLTAIPSGANWLFSAGPGWDPLTGWGTLEPVDFLTANANASIADYAYNGSSPGLPGPPGPLTWWETTVGLLVIGALALAIVFAVLAVWQGSRPRRPSGYYGPPPPGTYAPTPGGPPPPYGQGPPGPMPPPATFLCPYCGSVRPAEPVRCPSCGAY